MLKLLSLLILLATFPPLSIDMYLPAIPMLQAQWAVPLSRINLSLSIFMIGFSVALLIYGPLSDRIGRRIVLLGGVSIYTLASLMCSAASQPDYLILFRFFQGFGAAAAVSLSMAICKDRFDGQSRGRILAYMATVGALAPALAPVFGAWILEIADWHWIFLAQTILGLIALTGIWFLEETLKTPVRYGLLQAAGRYIAVIRNRRFMVFNIMMAITVIPFFGFIAGSSDIYIRKFGLAEQQFSHFFAFNAFALMCGAFLCARLSRKIKSSRLITVGFFGILSGALWMLVIEHRTPWSLALPMFCISLFLGLIRPLCNNEALEQVYSDVGAASSLLIFLQFVIASLSMWFISLEWTDKVRTLAIMGIVSIVIALVFWAGLNRKSGQIAEIREITEN